ncbi:hypothetical protein C8R44DRAFT_889335 [Mycena epipterygia]|nr:hypothetical protein C8R44DRAFT_889335 [Mycena epipterygia]
MARAWSRIERLRLMPFHSCHVKPRATIQCLLSFVRYCPWLESLAITLDTSTIPPPEGAPADIIPQQRLVTLQTPYSPIVASLPVARFISNLFPNLRRIGDEDADEVDLDGQDLAYHNIWMAVDMRPSFLAMHRDAEDT